ncbi:MAG: flavin reductase family protein [Burkholderiaceae bacterium]
MPADETSVDILLSTLAPSDRYKILCGVIVPRPIAWITTVSRQGVVNAAPFSFFNVFSEDPPLVVVGLQHHADGRLKDTTRNIHDTGEFVINLCDEPLAQSMNDTAIDFPAEASEIDAIDLATTPSVSIAPPRLSDAPFAFECTRQVSMAFGPGRELLVGEPLRVHARPGLLDSSNFHVDFSRYHPVGRLFGDLYSRQGDIFSMARESFAQFSERMNTR